MARYQAVNEILNICRDSWPNISWAYSKPEELDPGDGGRKKTRIYLANEWLPKELVPRCLAAEESCSAARQQIAGVRQALVQAIGLGGPSDLAAVAPAMLALEGAPGDETGGDEMIGPFSPAEWRKRFGGMSETTWRRIIKTLRTDVINSKSIRIHRDDVARYEKKDATTSH